MFCWPDQVHDFVKVRHKNLVRLIGYCDDGEHLALIYEFVAHGDLSDHLSGNEPCTSLFFELYILPEDNRICFPM